MNNWGSCPQIIMNSGTCMDSLNPVGILKPTLYFLVDAVQANEAMGGNATGDCC